jgi:hypothetical protein
LSEAGPLRSSTINKIEAEERSRERENRRRAEDNVGPGDTGRRAEADDGTDVIPRLIHRVFLSKISPNVLHITERIS